MKMLSSQNIQKYYDNLTVNTQKAYDKANEARSKGYDPEDTVEMPLAQDICDRVEGLVGPKGISKPMREYLQNHTREAPPVKIPASPDHPPSTGGLPHSGSLWPTRTEYDKHRRNTELYVPSLSR